MFCVLSAPFSGAGPPSPGTVGQNSRPMIASSVSSLFGAIGSPHGHPGATGLHFTSNCLIPPPPSRSQCYALKVPCCFLKKNKCDCVPTTAYGSWFERQEIIPCCATIGDKSTDTVFAPDSRPINRQRRSQAGEYYRLTARPKDLQPVNQSITFVQPLLTLKKPATPITKVASKGAFVKSNPQISQC
jgi:hypothetical protein